MSTTQRVMCERKIGDKIIKYSYPAERDRLVAVNGRWIEKIDFVMDVFGPKEVDAELRAMTGGKTYAELVGQADWKPKYHAWLEQMTQLALDRVNGMAAPIERAAGGI